MDWARYAIYWLPDGRLGRAGADWLGWDARTGRGLATGAPARYGFHATIKPPFRLANGTTGADVVVRARTLCGDLAPADLGRLSVTRLGTFLALTPERTPAALASAVVAGLDGFRAPASPEELTRRRAADLTPVQEALLDRWGYPYVMDEFRMHLTLTAPGPDEGTVARAEAAFAHDAGPHRIDALSLVGEDAKGRFHLIEDLPLRGHSGA